MGFNILNWLNPINRAADIIDQAVTDKDLKLKLDNELEMLKQQVYIAELGTQTVPWMDGVHKLGRQLLSFVSVIGGGVLLYFVPDTNPASLAMIVAPGGIYNYVKGKGRATGE